MFIAVMFLKEKLRPDDIFGEPRLCVSLRFLPRQVEHLAGCHVCHWFSGQEMAEKKF